MTEIEDTIWKFIHEDLPAAEFEQWVYAHPELEEFWGKKFYLDVISSGFVQARHVDEVRWSLRGWMATNKPPFCACITWERHQILDDLLTDFSAGQKFLAATLETIKQRDENHELLACRVCKQNWYLAIEVYVDHHLLRLSKEQVEEIFNNDQWPTDFDHLNTDPDDYFAPVNPSPTPYQSINDFAPVNPTPKTYQSILQHQRVPLGFFTAWLFIIFSKPSWQTLATGAPIAFLGVAIRAWASGHLRKNAELAISGPYAYTRNPLYFGSFILAIGIVICGGSWWLAVLLLGFFLAVYLPVMQAEAAHMHVLFPHDFAAYEQNVPLFLPRLTAWQTGPTGHFEQSLYLKYREYRALLGVIIVLSILILKITLHD